jgi:hypothetical protein
LRSSHAAAVYSALQQGYSEAMGERLLVIGADRDDLKDQVIVHEKLRNYDDPPILQYERDLLGWLVANCGPVSKFRSPEEFEEALRTRFDDDQLPIAPHWALSNPVAGALVRRFPAEPVFDAASQNPDLARAYDGLLKLLAFVFPGTSEEARSVEVVLSAFLWRIIAIADRLQRAAGESDRAMEYRLGLLRERVVGMAGASAFEKTLWRALDEHVVLRRHVLTHLSHREDTRRETWTFCRCVDEQYDNEALLTMCAAISTAVLDQFAADLRDMPAPAGMFEAATRVNAWVLD